MRQDTGNMAALTYSAETYCVLDASPNSEIGWCVKAFDDTVCDVYEGQAMAERIAELLNANGSASVVSPFPSDELVAGQTLPNLDRNAQAVLLGALQLVEFLAERSVLADAAMLEVMRKSVRCALADHTVGREVLCEKMVSEAYRRTYNGETATSEGEPAPWVSPRCRPSSVLVNQVSSVQDDTRC